MRKIYLDYAATTPVDSEVFVAMKPYFSGNWGNAGSLHYFGQKAMKALDESREKIANLIGADFREIIFTGSATEANNLALRGVVRAVRLFSDGTGRLFSPAEKSGLGSRPDGSRLKSGDQARQDSETFRAKKTKSPYRIIISSIEHESILETARELEKDGVEVIYLPVDKNGLVNLKKLKESLNERTVLVSIMYANNEIGTIEPIREISKIIKDFRGSNFYPLFHTDAVQAFQFLNCDANKLGVDLMTLSAHKIYGPKGVGALYARSLNSSGYLLSPSVTGGGQEFGLRSGTENIPSIVGLAKAVELAEKNREKEAKRISALRDYFFKGLQKANPKIKLNGPPATQASLLALRAGPIKNRLPNNLNVYFPGKSAGDLLVKLDLAGIAVSAGSACSARSLEPSRVLKACGLSLNIIKSSLRISLGKFTTKAELNETIRIFKLITNN